MTIDAIARPPSLVEKVCQRLAQLVRHDTKGNSDRLPTERDLATQLGVSRSVVREATKRLEQQGLLEIRQGKGTRTVNRLHKPLNGALELALPDEAERLRQLTEVRLMVEPENARLAATRASKAQLAALNDVVEKLAAASDFEVSVTADMSFHRLLAEASGNQIAALLLNSLSDLLHASLMRGYKRVAPDKAVKEHRAIVRAIQRGDAVAAAKAMRDHLITARDDLGLTPKPSRR